MLEASFDLKDNIGIFPGALDGPSASWELNTQFRPPDQEGHLVFSINQTNDVFSAKRLPGPRTIRDLMMALGSCSFQSLHRTFRWFRKKKYTSIEQATGAAEDKDHENVMDVESFLHQKSWSS